MYAACSLHQTQPVKLRGALTGVWLGAKNEEEMNYMAPSHSPADSISTESQLYGCVCVCVYVYVCMCLCTSHKYLPQPSPSHHPKGASLMVMAKGCRCLGD